MKQKDIMFLLISSVILTIAWIVFTIIHKSISSTITPLTNEQITSINPYFDDKTITVIKTRMNTIPAFSFQSISSSTSALPTPSLNTLTPTTIPTPIPSGSISLITKTPVNTNGNQASSGGKISQ